MCRARSASANEVAAKLTSTFRRRISSTECKSWVEHEGRINEISFIYVMDKLVLSSRWQLILPKFSLFFVFFAFLYATNKNRV